MQLLETQHDDFIPLIWHRAGPDFIPGALTRMQYYELGYPTAVFCGTQDVSMFLDPANDFPAAYAQCTGQESDVELDISQSFENDQLLVDVTVHSLATLVTPECMITVLLTRYDGTTNDATVVAWAQEPLMLPASGQSLTEQIAIDFDATWNLQQIHTTALVQVNDAAPLPGDHAILQAKKVLYSGLLPVITADLQSGPPALGVQFTSLSLPVSGISSWQWDFNSDGSIDSTEEHPWYLFEAVGSYDVTLTVSDGESSVTRTFEDFITVEAPIAIAGVVQGQWRAANSPYQIAADICVPAGSSLEIEPGTEISITQDAAIEIHGQLIAGASDAVPVIVGGNDWSGLRFINSLQDNQLYNCQISGAVETAVKIDSSAVLLEDCILYQNHSDYGGGAIDVIFSTDVTVNRCTVVNNTSASAAGGVHVSHGAIAVCNSIICNNSGSMGSALAIKNDGNADLTNCTIANNSGPCAVFVFMAQADILNSIIIDTTQPLTTLQSTVDAQYNCINASVPGTGNIDFDPLFDAPTIGNGAGFDALAAAWTLQPGSPCQDAGHPDAQYNDRDGSRNDMGAFGGPEGMMQVAANHLPETLAPLSCSIYPNPFNPSTRIFFSIAEPGLHPSITIYNTKGQKVRTMALSQQDVLNGSVIWHGLNDNQKPVSSGVYLLHLQAGAASQTHKITVIK